MIIGNRTFDTKKHTYIMGIMNITPDSFSDGGKYNQKDLALEHAQKLVSEGADILDIGGESTRPGHAQITAKEEIERVLPIIESLKKEFDVPLSIDTYKSQVAEEALKAGVHLINDIWGLKYDDKMAGLVAKYNVPICLMHNCLNIQYERFISDVIGGLMDSVELAFEAGIDQDKIILDPGVGFAKSYENNLQIVKHLQEFTKLEFPILLGTSRKSMIGLTLDLPFEEREEGTLVTTVMAVMAGCAFVRVHDVEKNKRAIQMTEAIIKGN
ncbi:MAG: dihydropteroate synthase [Lachnospiraceae bacterium]|nr:dihydropteroate synthase [Lachnospiraceae bacterium]